MKNIIKIVGGAIIAVLLVDAGAFIWWILSNQQPVDGFYFGAITENIIRAIIALVS